ncbi:MAG: sodium:proline symporter, partial [Bacteroidetes bacterium]|nr:sodium:proline symporter [Bacteroidota bacterium]
QFIIECGAGLGLVLLLRWYWWRVNAWSEIAATLTPALVYGGIALVNASSPTPLIVFPESMFLIVGVTTVVWLAVTMLTRPTEASVLDAFYRRVRPTGFWKGIAERHPDIITEGAFLSRLAGWLLGVLMIYSVLFLFGAVFFGTVGEMLLWLALAVTSALLLWYMLARLEKVQGHDAIL